jgi:hypothetical protein
LANLLGWAVFERVGQHDHAETGVAEVGSDTPPVRLELGRDDDDGGFRLLLDVNGVVDTPRRARASIPEPHHPALDESGPLVEIGAGLVRPSAHTLTSDEAQDVGSVGSKAAFPLVDDDEVRLPSEVEAQADANSIQRPSERERLGLPVLAWRRRGQENAH